MVRREQDSGFQLRAITFDQLRFLRGFDIAGQQNRPCALRDFQGAAARIRLESYIVITGCGRLQHVEAHAIPDPALAGNATTVPGRSLHDSAGSGMGKTLPSNASGVTNRLISGIATAFASGLTSDSWPNSSKLKGTRPIVITYCKCAADFRLCSQRKRSGKFATGRVAVRSTDANSNTATAPNDSQKPGHNTAHGSSNNTTPSAMHSTCEMLVSRALQSARATALTMYRVRCAGTPNPASKTYSKAVNTPASAAAFCAGSHSGKNAFVKNERRHKADTSAAASPAIIVMCRPEIEI